MIRRSPLTSHLVALVALALAPGVFACSGMQVVAPSDRAVLEVTCVPDDAEVWVDGRPAGTLDRLHGRVILTEGSRRIELVADGYLPHRFDLVVEAEELYLLEVELWPAFEEIDGSRAR